MRETFEWLNSAKTINNALIGIAVACSSDTHIKKRPMHSVRVRQLTQDKATLAFERAAAPPVQRIKILSPAAGAISAGRRQWAPFSTSLRGAAAVSRSAKRENTRFCAFYPHFAVLPPRRAFGSALAIKCRASLYCARKIYKESTRDIKRRYRWFHY